MVRFVVVKNVSELTLDVVNILEIKYEIEQATLTVVEQTIHISFSIYSFFTKLVKVIRNFARLFKNCTGMAKRKHGELTINIY